MEPYILFGGDFVPDKQLEDKARAQRLYYEHMGNMIRNSQHFFVNLECPLTTATNEIFKSGPSLKGDPDSATWFREIGLTGVFLANNHMMDYGNAGLSSTIQACRNQNLLTLGAGDTNTAAREPLFIEVEGVSIGVINIAENEFGAATDSTPGINTFDLIENIKLIRLAKQKCDVLILSLHAGLEYFDLPRPELRKLCRFFIEEGVDAIICHHTHIASAYETINNKPIFYGIGNFAFNTNDKSAGWSNGYLVKVTIDTQQKCIGNHEIIPYTQDITGHGIRAMDGAVLTHFLSRIDDLNNILSNEAKHIELWRNFCLKKIDEYAILMYFPLIQWPIKVLKRIPFISRILQPEFRSAVRLNLLRCESHFEVFKLIHEYIYSESRRNRTFIENERCERTNSCD